MAKEEAIKFSGEITEVLPNAMFRVLLDNGHLSRIHSPFSLSLGLWKTWIAMQSLSSVIPLRRSPPLSASIGISIFRISLLRSN